MKWVDKLFGRNKKKIVKMHKVDSAKVKKAIADAEQISNDLHDIMGTIKEKEPILAALADITHNVMQDLRKIDADMEHVLQIGVFVVGNVPGKGKDEGFVILQGGGRDHEDGRVAAMRHALEIVMEATKQHGEAKDMEAPGWTGDVAEAG